MVIAELEPTTSMASPDKIQAAVRLFYAQCARDRTPEELEAILDSLELAADIAVEFSENSPNQ